MRLKEINQKILAKEGRLERYQDRVKQYKQNRSFQNYGRKFYQQAGRECTRTNQQSDAKETKQFGGKIWEQKEYKKKVKWINNTEKELLKEGSEVGIHLESHRTRKY